MIRHWVFLLIVVFCCCFVAVAESAQEKNASDETELPDTKQVTAEALAQALSRSASAKEYLLIKSEKVQQQVKNDSIDKRGALKSLSGVDISLLWMEIDFFTLVAHQAHMEATAALGGAEEKNDTTEGTANP